MANSQVVGPFHDKLAMQGLTQRRRLEVISDQPCEHRRARIYQASRMRAIARTKVGHSTRLPVGKDEAMRDLSGFAQHARGLGTSSSGGHRVVPLLVQRESLLGNRKHC